MWTKMLKSFGVTSAETCTIRTCRSPKSPRCSNSWITTTTQWVTQFSTQGRSTRKTWKKWTTNWWCSRRRSSSPSSTRVTTGITTSRWTLQMPNCPKWTPVASWPQLKSRMPGTIPIMCWATPRCPVRTSFKSCRIWRKGSRERHRRGFLGI